jgi:hypothetical protein
MPIKGACVVAGIAVSTLAEWREKHPQIKERMSETRERARKRHFKEYGLLARRIGVPMLNSCD